MICGDIRRENGGNSDPRSVRVRYDFAADDPKMLLTDTVVGGGSTPSSSGGESKGSQNISTPYLIDCYPVITTGDRTREGGRQLAHSITLPTSLPWGDNFSQLREKRRRGPEEPWGVNSDPAQQIIGHAPHGTLVV